MPCGSETLDNAPTRLEKCAGAGLYLQSSNTQRSTQCTYLQQGHNYLSDTNSLYINFYSRIPTVRGGFWFIYKGLIVTPAPPPAAVLSLSSYSQSSECRSSPALRSTRDDRHSLRNETALVVAHGDIVQSWLEQFRTRESHASHARARRSSTVSIGHFGSLDGHPDEYVVSTEGLYDRHNTV